MKERITDIAGDDRVKAALIALSENIEQTVELAIAIQQIPAPTFEEAERAAYVYERLRALGLRDVQSDDLHNVYARWPGASGRENSAVVITAHIDTVFPSGTDLSTRRDGKLIYGPGLGDNATGVAGLLALAQALKHHGLIPEKDLWFVANTGEEGLGDLRGMRAVVDRFGEKVTYIVVEGGLFGQLSHQGIAVRRFRIDVKAEGGHSWGSFGNSSAIHALGRVISQIGEIEVPGEPKTTFNVGVIEGGTSINTIAQSAHLLLDLRSEDDQALGDLIGKVEAIVSGIDGEKDVSVAMIQIGNRPAGSIPRDAPLVEWAVAALSQVGWPQAEFMAGSTDANIPLSRGIPSVCVGLAESGNTHRLDEYLDPSRLPDGLGQLLLLTLAAAGFEPASDS